MVVIKDKFVLILLVVFLIPFVVGSETTLTIQSEPNADITLRFLDLNTGRIIDPVSGVFYLKGDETGKAYVSYNTLDKLLRFTITVQKGNSYKEFDSVNGSTTKLAKFNYLESGKEIFINLNTNVPIYKIEGEEDEVEGDEIIEDDIGEDNEENDEEIIEGGELIEVVEKLEGTTKSTTGNVVGAIKEASPIIKKIFYFALIIGGIGAFFMLGFSLFKKRSSKKSNSSIKLRDKMDKKGLSLNSLEEAELMDAERRIKEAEDEIKDIRTKSSRIKEAEKKFEEDKKLLDELKGDD